MLRDVEQRMRKTLVELELCSTAPARAFVPVISSGAPESAPPVGESSPAERWRNTYNNAAGDAGRRAALRGADDELRHLRRRQFRVGIVVDGDDLRQRVLVDGEGALPDEVALALRCTPTFVRRTRLADGRDAQHGRTIVLERWDAQQLLEAGMSVRAVALVTGTPSSTVHDHSRM